MYQSLHARVEDLLETEMGAALSGECQNDQFLYDHQRDIPQ
jgi:hypothetical protein